MKEFCGLCFIAGFACAGMLTFIIPRSVTGVNNELIKAGLAHYNKNNGMVEWNDVKEKEVKEIKQ